MRERPSCALALALVLGPCGCAGPAAPDPPDGGGGERAAAEGEEGTGPAAPDDVVRPGSCAAPLPLPLGQRLQDDTTGRPSSARSSCGGHDQEGDVVFSLEAPAAGALHLFPELPDDDRDGLPDWLGTIAVTRSCGDPTSEISCASMIGDSIACVDHAGPVYLAVDGNDSYSIQQGDVVLRHPADTGPFGLEVRYEICGPGDACVDGRGCTMRLDGGETCADAPLVPLDADEPRRFVASADASTDEIGLSCSDPPGAEVVYRLEAPGRGRLFAVLSPQPGVEVAASLRPGCEAGAGELACGAEGWLVACVDRGPLYLVAEAVEGAGRFGVALAFEPCDGCDAGDCP